jgi:hypothetical protein
MVWFLLRIFHSCRTLVLDMRVLLGRVPIAWFLSVGWFMLSSGVVDVQRLDLYLVLTTMFYAYLIPYFLIEGCRFAAVQLAGQVSKLAGQVLKLAAQL